MRNVLIFIVLAVAAIILVACAHESAPAQAPAAQTQTTSGAYAAPARSGNPDLVGVEPQRAQPSSPRGDMASDPSNVASPSAAGGAIEIEHPPKGANAPSAPYAGRDGGM